MRAELGHVVGEECGLVAGAGDGDVAEAGVEQVRVDAGVVLAVVDVQEFTQQVIAVKTHQN